MSPTNPHASRGAGPNPGAAANHQSHDSHQSHESHNLPRAGRRNRRRAAVRPRIPMQDTRRPNGRGRRAVSSGKGGERGGAAKRPGGGARAGWQVRTLGELLERTETVNPLQSPEAEFEYIDVSSVSNQTFRIVETQRLKGKDAPSRARRLVRANDVLFATNGKQEQVEPTVPLFFAASGQAHRLQDGKDAQLFQVTP